MENFCALVLAAGKGKRMKFKTPKVLCKVLEKPMICWVLDALKEAKIKERCVIVNCDSDDVKNAIKDENVSFITQKEQKGTADAVKAARGFLKNNEDLDVFISCADSPLLDCKTILDSHELHKKLKADVTIITAKVLNKKGFGRIVRDSNDNIIKIVEEKDATKQEYEIDEVNSGAYWFKTKSLLKILDEIECENLQNEYYLTDAIDVFFKHNKKIIGFVSKNSNVVLGANTGLELLKINEIARKNIIEKFIEKGVEFVSTDGVLIYPDVNIGNNTVILPGCVLKNGTIIGENCTIGPNTLIENSKIGNCCKINNSQVYSSVVNDYTTIGPFCNIRPNSEISHHVKIGDFVEVKNSKIGAGSSVSHLTYVGDSDVGKNVNFGCGVVTINFDGVEKNRCEIGDGAFLGCNTNLVAPIKLGKNSYTGAGSTITKNVPDEALAVERTKQVIVENFSKKKLAKRKLKVEY